MPSNILPGTQGIPPRNTCFAGLKPEPGKIASSLKVGRPVFISGPAGCGKSELAVEAIYRLFKNQKMKPPSQFTDGVIRINMTPAVRFADVCRILCAFSKGEYHPKSPYDSLIKAVRHKKILLFAENLDSSEWIPKLLHTGISLLATGENYQAASGMTEIRLTDADEEEIAARLQKMQTVKKTYTAEDIYRHTGGMRLSINLLLNAEQYTPNMPIDQKNLIVSSVSLRQEEIKNPARRYVHCASLAEQVIKRYGNGGTGLYSLLGKLAFCPVPAYTIQQCCAALHIPYHQGVLDNMVQVGLLNHNPSGYNPDADTYSITHPIYYQYAGEIPSGGMMLRTVRKVFVKLYTEALDEALAPHVRALVYGSNSHTDDDEETIKLLQLLIKHEIQSGNTEDAYEFCLTGIHKTQEFYPELYSLFIFAAGDVCMRANQYPEAQKYFTDALALFRKENNFSGQINALIGFADISKQQSDDEQSLQYLNQASHILMQIPENDIAHYDAGISLRKGIIHLNLANIEQSLTEFKRAYQLYSMLESTTGKLTALNYLTDILNKSERYEEVLLYYGDALESSQITGDTNAAMRCLLELGDILLKTDRALKSVEAYETGLSISRAAGNPDMENMFISGLGKLYLQTSEYEKAIAVYRDGITVCRKTKDRRNEAGHTANLGLAYRKSGKDGLAVKHWEKALNLFNEDFSPEKDTIKQWLENVSKNK